MQGKRCCVIACEYCWKDIGHHPRCPLYEPKKTEHYCFICGEGIYDGERYIVNDSGDLAHQHCFYKMYDSIYWDKYAINTMED